MKRTIAFMFMFAVAATTFGQSKSFEALSHAFSDEDNVMSLSFGGLSLKWTSDEDDKTLSGIRDVRFLNIPRTKFDAGKVKVSSFKRDLTRESFEELFSARDGKDNVSVYLQENRGDHNNLYFVLVEGDENVFALELKGYIDPKSLKEKKTRSKLTGM